MEINLLELIAICICWFLCGISVKKCIDEFRKHNTKKEVTLEGWVARDGDGLPRQVHLFTALPKREEEKIFKGWIRSWRGPTRMRLPKSSFPEVTWEDEPKKVSVTIKAE